MILGLGLCLISGAPSADEAATRQLIEQLQGVEQLQGDFEQQQFAPDSDEQVGTSSGNFKLLRPGYFAWEITAPDSQLIIANPQHVWHHDRDLETVTRRPVEGNEAMSPLQVLGGDSSVLHDNYEVNAQGEGQYRLVPLAENAGFKSLQLTLEGGMLVGMLIRDNLDQRLLIRFSNVSSDGGLTPEDFSFAPPEGADLFYHDQ